jgi:hypothetical protein
MMDRVLTKLKSSLKSSEEGGFKFAISLIALCLGFLFKIHDY